MRRTQLLTREHIRVGRSSAGLGIFARCTLMPGMYLEYIGEHISNEEADRRENTRYLFEVNKKLTIDGSARTNIARYFNHSCEPNCAVMVRTPHVYICVTRKIAAGEELTFNYGKEYFDFFIGESHCRCPKHAGRAIDKK